MTQEAEISSFEVIDEKIPSTKFNFILLFSEKIKE